jgi:hypothetical protein
VAEARLTLSNHIQVILPRLSKSFGVVILSLF